MIEPVGAYPPFRRFHQHLRVIIPVGEEGVKRKAYIMTLLGDLAVTHCKYFLLKAGSQYYSFRVRDSIRLGRIIMVLERANSATG
jgi:hypothetical protein